MAEPRLEDDLLNIARPLAPTQADLLETCALVLALAVGEDGGISMARAVECMERLKHLCDMDHEHFLRLDELHDRAFYERRLREEWIAVGGTVHGSFFYHERLPGCALDSRTCWRYLLRTYA